MIKCGGCGCNYQAETSGGKRYWRCRKNRDGIPLREDVLQAMTARVLGMDAFDDAAVMERMDTILVDGGVLVFRLTDGREVRCTWERPIRVGHKHTEEHKEHMRRLMKEKWTSEKKAAMSENMKKLRKERGDQWRKR